MNWAGTCSTAVARLRGEGSAARTTAVRAFLSAVLRANFCRLARIVHGSSSSRECVAMDAGTDALNGT